MKYIGKIITMSEIQIKIHYFFGQHCKRLREIKYNGTN